MLKFLLAVLDDDWSHQVRVHDWYGVRRLDIYTSHTPYLLTGVNHGGGQGGLVPGIWSRRRYCKLSPRFLAFQPHDSNSLCVFTTSQSTSSMSTNRDQTITPSGKFNIFLTKARTKDTAGNTPKRVISSEKVHRFAGEGLRLSQTPSMARVPPPTSYLSFPPNLWNPPLRPSEFNSDLYHCTNLLNYWTISISKHCMSLSHQNLTLHVTFYTTAVVLPHVANLRPIIIYLTNTV